MAVTSIRTCDSCGSNDDVQILTVAYGKKVFEIDMCSTCYADQCGRYVKKARRATRSTMKPQHRFAITEVSKVNL